MPGYERVPQQEAIEMPPWQEQEGDLFTLANLPTLTGLQSLEDPNTSLQNKQAFQDKFFRRYFHLYVLAGRKTVEDLHAYEQDPIKKAALVTLAKQLSGLCAEEYFKKLTPQAGAEEERKDEEEKPTSQQGLTNDKLLEETKEKWKILNTYIKAQNTIIEQTLRQQNIPIRTKEKMSPAMFSALAFALFGSLSVAAFALTACGAVLLPALPYLIGAALIALALTTLYVGYKKISKIGARTLLIGAIATPLILAHLGKLAVLGVLTAFPPAVPIIIFTSAIFFLGMFIATQVLPRVKPKFSLKAYNLAQHLAREIGFLIVVAIPLALAVLALAYPAVLPMATAVLAAGIALAVVALVSLAGFFKKLFTPTQSPRLAAVNEMITIERDLIKAREEPVKIRTETVGNMIRTTVAVTLTDEDRKTLRGDDNSHGEIKQSKFSKRHPAVEASTNHETPPLKQTLSPYLRGSSPSMTNVNMTTLSSSETKFDMTVFTGSTPAAESIKDPAERAAQVKKNVTFMKDKMLKNFEQDPKEKALKNFLYSEAQAAAAGEAEKGNAEEKAPTPFLLYNNILSPFAGERALASVHTDNNDMFVESAKEAVASVDSKSKDYEFAYLNRAVNAARKDPMVKTFARETEEKLIKHVKDMFVALKRKLPDTEAGAGDEKNYKEKLQACIDYLAGDENNKTFPEEKLKIISKALMNGSLISQDANGLSHKNQTKLARKLQAACMLQRLHNGDFPVEKGSKLDKEGIELYKNALSAICADRAWVGCKSSRDRTAHQLAAIAVLLKHPGLITEPQKNADNKNFMTLVCKELNTGHYLKMGDGFEKWDRLGLEQNKDTDPYLKGFTQQTEAMAKVCKGKAANDEEVKALVDKYFKKPNQAMRNKIDQHEANASHAARSAAGSQQNHGQ